MNRVTKIIIGILVGVGIVAALLFYGAIFGGSEDSPEATEATLDFWVPSDSKFAYQHVFRGFKMQYPNVDINFRSFDSPQSYERNLLDALAAGRGPDIFMIRNNDLVRNADKIYPMPPSKYTPLDIRNQFPDIVYENFVSNETIFALPTSIDTLSLIYNSNMFEEEGIVFPPETWTEFRDIVPQLTEYGTSTNSIERSAAAIGGASNISNAKDILSLMFMQTGAEMVNDRYTSARFSTRGTIDATEFYAQFSDPDSQYYTWNNNMPDAIDAFSDGRVAMIFDYSTAVSDIESRSPFLDIKIAKTPQFADQGNEVSYGHFWGYTVSRQSEYPEIAWDFVLHLTTDDEVAEGYINSTNKPPALLTLIDKNINDPRLSVFAKQALTAKAWPEPDPERVTEVFNDMIQDIMSGQLYPSSAVNRARNEVTRMITERQ